MIKPINHSKTLTRLTEHPIESSTNTLKEVIDFYRGKMRGKSNVFTVVVLLHGIYDITPKAETIDYDYGEVYGETYKVMNVSPLATATYSTQIKSSFLFGLLMNTEWPPELIYRLIFPISYFREVASEKIVKPLMHNYYASEHPDKMYEFHSVNRGDRIVNKMYSDEPISPEFYSYLPESKIKNRLYSYFPIKTINDFHNYLIMQEFCLKLEGIPAAMVIEIKHILDVANVPCIQDSAKMTYYNREFPERTVIVITYEKGDNLMQCKNFIAWNILQQFLSMRERERDPDELAVFVLKLLSRHVTKSPITDKFTLGREEPFLLNTCVPKYKQLTINKREEYIEFPERPGLVDCVNAEFAELVNFIRGVSRRGKKIDINEYFDKSRYNIGHKYFGADNPDDEFMLDFIEIINKCKRDTPGDALTSFLNTYDGRIETSVPATNPFAVSLFKTSQKIVNMFIGDNKIMIFTPSCSCTQYRCLADCKTIERLHTSRSRIARGKSKTKKRRKN